MKFRNKTVVIDAFIWKGECDQGEYPAWAIIAIANGDLRILKGGNTVEMSQCGIIMVAPHGHYVIKKPDGYFFPCSPKLFHEYYEQVDTLKSGPAQANPSLGVGPCSAPGVDLNPVAGKHRMGETC